MIALTQSYHDLALGKRMQSRDVVAHSHIDTSPMAGRVGYATVSLAALCLLVACFAIRVKNLRLHNLSKMNTMRALVISVYLLGILFILSATILQFGVGLSDISRCKSAIILCLVFYVGGKIVMYTFLCERMHAIRQNYLSRWQDKFWIASILTVLIGFGIIAIFSFVEPVYDISKVDGKCRIGLPFKITLPLLIYDIVINTSLTAVFFYLVRPYMQKGLPNFLPLWMAKSISKLSKNRMKVADIRNNALDQRGIVERVAWKSLLACVAVLCSTVANLSLLFYMRGYEQGWLCFTLCTIDIAWGAIVVHALTRDPTEIDGKTSALVSRSRREHHHSCTLNSPVIIDTDIDVETGKVPRYPSPTRITESSDGKSEL